VSVVDVTELGDVSESLPHAASATAARAAAARITKSRRSIDIGRVCADPH
jgi:hypothetical protein